MRPRSTMRHSQNQRLSSFEGMSLAIHTRLGPLDLIYASSILLPVPPDCLYCLITTLANPVGSSPTICGTVSTTGHRPVIHRCVLTCFCGILTRKPAMTVTKMLSPTSMGRMSLTGWILGRAG